MTDQRIIITINGHHPKTTDEWIIRDMELHRYFLVSMGIDPINCILQMTFDVEKDEKMLRKSMRAIIEMDIDNMNVPAFIIDKISKAKMVLQSISD